MKSKKKITPNSKAMELNALLNEDGGAVKIYGALYCPCLYESVYETLSIHKTKEGAECAVQKHKDYIKKEYDDMNIFYEKSGIEKSRFNWDVDQQWNISETELMD